MLRAAYRSEAAKVKRFLRKFLGGSGCEVKPICCVQHIVPVPRLSTGKLKIT
jgi:hypothetical protein